MKNILIQTDFSVESLNVLKQFLQQESNHTNNSYHIHFVTGYNRGDSIIDLLFFSEEKIIDQLKNNIFDEACSILENKYSSCIHRISYHLFSGYFQSNFDSFIELNKIDEIYTSTLKLNHKNTNVFDLKRYIKKAKITTKSLEIKSSEYQQSRGLLAEFFT